MKNLKLHVATWILSRFVPARDREALVGDLTEEHARLTAAGRRDAPFGWYLRHVCASIPPLVWAGLARATWPTTLAIALAAFFLTVLMQTFVQWAIRSLAVKVDGPVAMVIFSPLVLLIGYLAERIRRRTSIVFGALLLLTIAAMTVWDLNTGKLHIQRQLPAYLLGLAVICIGVATKRRRSSAR